MAAQNNSPLPDGLEIAGYRIVKKIASGGFSIVYMAYDDLGNAVAIKEYLPSALALRKPGELTVTIPQANLPVFHIGLKCFFEEGRSLARISHPNVVSVLNFFRANETVYMVMAYESGHSLQDHILIRRDKGSKPIMPEKFIRNVFRQVINGLREVHTNRLLHLDLKPANIYLRVSGVPLLLDFGAARQVFNSNMPKLNSMYTPGFAPPELYVKGSDIGPWTDIYGVGASMFACMTGTPPQPADVRKNNDKLESYLERLQGMYSPELIGIVSSCLKIDPLERPKSMFELQKSLSDFKDSEDAPKEKPAASRLRGLLTRLGRKDSTPTTVVE